MVVVDLLRYNDQTKGRIVAKIPYSATVHDEQELKIVVGLLSYNKSGIIKEVRIKYGKLFTLLIIISKSPTQIILFQYISQSEVSGPVYKPGSANCILVLNLKQPKLHWLST